MEKKRSKDLSDAPSQKAKDALSLDTVVAEIKAVREAIPLPEGFSLDFLPIESPDAGIRETCRLQLMELLGELQEIKRQYDEAKSQLKQIHEAKAEVGGLQSRIDEAETEKLELQSRWAAARTTRAMKKQLEKVQEAEQFIAKMREDLEKKTTLIRGEEDREEKMEQCIHQAREVLFSTRDQVMNLLKPKAIIPETSAPRPEPVAIPSKMSKAKKKRERKMRRQFGKGHKQGESSSQQQKKKKKHKERKYNFPKEQPTQTGSGKEYTVRAPSFMTQSNAEMISADSSQAICLANLPIPMGERDRAEDAALRSKMKVLQLDYSPHGIQIHGTEHLPDIRQLVSQSKTRARATLEQFETAATRIEVLRPGKSMTMPKTRDLFFTSSPLNVELLREEKADKAPYIWIQNIRHSCSTREQQIHALKNIIGDYEERMGNMHEHQLLARAAFAHCIILYCERVEQLFRELDAEKKEPKPQVAESAGGMTMHTAPAAHTTNAHLWNDAHFVKWIENELYPKPMPVRSDVTEKIGPEANQESAALPERLPTSSAPNARTEKGTMSTNYAGQYAVLDTYVHRNDPKAAPAPTAQLRDESATAAYRDIGQDFTGTLARVSGPVVVPKSTSAPVHMETETSLPGDEIEFQQKEAQIEGWKRQYVEPYLRERGPGARLILHIPQRAIIENYQYKATEISHNALLEALRDHMDFIKPPGATTTLKENAEFTMVAETLVHCLRAVWEGRPLSSLLVPSGLTPERKAEWQTMEQDMKYEPGSPQKRLVQRQSAPRAVELLNEYDAMFQEAWIVWRQFLSRVCTMGMMLERDVGGESAADADRMMEAVTETIHEWILMPNIKYLNDHRREWSSFTKDPHFLFQIMHQMASLENGALRSADRSLRMKAINATVITMLQPDIKVAFANCQRPAKS